MGLGSDGNERVVPINRQAKVVKSGQLTPREKVYEFVMPQKIILCESDAEESRC